MPGQEQQTAAVVEREPPETGPVRERDHLPEGGEWQAYSVDVLNDLLDS